MSVREFGARLSLRDNMADQLRRNVRQQQEFTRQINNTRRSVQDLGRESANPDIDVDDRGARSTIDRIREALHRVGREKILSRAEVDDRATQSIENIKAKLKEIGRTFTPIVKIRDMATKGISKIKNTLGGLVKATFFPVLKVKDLATKGINGVRVGLRAIGKVVVNPIINAKDKATEIISKVAGGLKKVGSTVAKPFIALKDGATKAITTIGSKLKSIGSTVARATVAVKDNASKVLGGITSTLSTIATGATIALSVAGAGTMASLNEGAKLQQSTGGVETLFKDDASKVIENANKAFMTAGLSANEYMENVTSFSASLLSSLGGDTAKSAEVADMAMIDMADNANKFGTDMGSIQNAYQGFAKQNYTMLDNLKLGYGGTQEEMKRLLADAQKISGVQYDMSNLADVYNAIHVIQENLDVTGTTAKEASVTFAGSMASMKSAFSNLMGSLSVGDGEAVARTMGELLETASTFLFSNLVPMVQTIFNNLPTAISTASSKIMPKLKETVKPMAISMFEGLKEGLASIGVDMSLFQGVIDAVDPKKFNLGGFSEMFGLLKTGFSSTFNTVLTILPPVIQTVQNVAPIFMNIIQTIQSGVNQLIPYIQPVVQTIMNLIQTAMPVIQTIITTVVNAIVAIMPTLSAIFQTVGSAIQKVLSVIGEHMGLFQTIVSVVVTVVGTVWQALAPVISSAVDLIISIVDSLLTGIETVFEFLSPYISQIWDSICGFFDSASTTITDVIGVLSSIFEDLKGVVETVFSSIGDTISTICGGVADTISGVVDKVSGFVEKIGGAISTAKEFAGSAISKVGNVLGFAYGKNRVPYNEYPAMLHQGERVLTRVQADQYDKIMQNTRGIPSRAMGTGVIARDNTLINAHQGEKLLTKQEAKRENTKSINVEKLADQIVVREDADIDKIVNKLVKRLEKVEGNVVTA